jgi:prephenate dehydrogenase
MEFQRITILGVGLLGGSIGLAAKSYSNRCVITGYGHRESTLKKAVEVGAIDKMEMDLGKSVSDADLVILCTPVGLFEKMIVGMRDSLPKGAIVTDVGSTKRTVVGLGERLLGERFVGSHPMAGSEKRGVEYARTDLFKKALCIMTPTGKTRAEVVGKVKQFWMGLGMRVTSLTPREHDRLLAMASHLPHAAAAAMVSMQLDEGLLLCGKGFLDTTRIAGGDGALWSDIFLDNADNVRLSINLLKQELDQMSSLIEKRDGEALAKWLNAAALRREELMRSKLREMEE